MDRVDRHNLDKRAALPDIGWEKKLEHMNRAFKRRRLEWQAGLRGNLSDVVSSSLHIFAENGHAITNQPYMPACSTQQRNKRRPVRKRALSTAEKKRLQKQHIMWSTLLSDAPPPVDTNVTTQVEAAAAPDATEAVDTEKITHAVEAVDAVPALGLPTTGLKIACSLEHPHAARHPPDATSVQYDPLLPKNDVSNISNAFLSPLCVDDCGSNT